MFYTSNVQKTKFIGRTKLKIRLIGYLLPFAVATFCMEEASGQWSWENNWWGWHSESIQPINLFISQDTTSAALEYNSLQTKAQRDSCIQVRLYEDWTSTIASRGELDGPPYWMCGHWQRQLLVNSHDWGNQLYVQEVPYLMFDGYDGFVLDSIYAHGGTLKDIGKMGLQMCGASFQVPEYAHAIAGVLTGDDITKWESWNFIEPRNDRINEQPGEENLKLDSVQFDIFFQFVYENEQKEKILDGIPIAKFTINNGIPLFIGLNPKVNIITQREGDPPVINIKQGTDLDSLVATINDANLKSVWYTIDGGAKIPLMTEMLAPVTEKKVAIKMNLPAGTHQIAVGADDYFKLSSEKAEERTIAANALPVITITSPVNGQVYGQDVQMIYSITDTDFASAWYSINGGTKTTINQNGTIPLTLVNGLYKIVIEATDQKPQSVKDSVSFEIKKATGIDDEQLTEGIQVYPNPVKDQVNIEYKFDTPQVIYRELYNIEGVLLFNDKKDIAGEETDQINMSEYAGGTYILRQRLGKYTRTTKMVKQ